jgi:hypothetical protein
MSTTRKTIEMMLKREIDPEALERFVNDVTHRRPVDHDDAMEAAVLIVALRVGAQAGDNMTSEIRKLFRAPKLNKGKYDFRPADAAIDSPAFNIVIRHIRDKKKFPIEKAVEEFTWYVAEADVKTIKGWIEIIEPRAKEHLRQEAELKSKYGGKNS